MQWSEPATGTHRILAHGAGRAANFPSGGLGASIAAIALCHTRLNGDDRVDDEDFVTLIEAYNQLACP